MIYYVIVILSVFAAACAQMLLKKGAMLPSNKDHKYSLIRQYLNPMVIGGYTIMGLTMIANVFAMSHGVHVKDVGIIESLSYLFVPCLSWILFQETLNRLKLIAIVVIMVGVIMFFV